MKKLTIIFLLLFNIIYTFSQTREIVLIIDTIERAEIYLLEGFSPSVNYGGFANLPKEIETEQFSNIRFPNFISKKIVMQDTSTITIPVSKQNDIIEINGFQNMLNDTLRINKLPKVQNDLPDTTYTIKYWFIKKDSLIPLPDKTEKFIDISKKKTKKLRNHLINLTINYKKYTTILIATKGPGVIMHGSGTRPRNPYKKNGERKKNVKLFNVESLTKEWIYKATIIL